MVNRKELNPASSPRAAYGARIRQVREGFGWSQEDLAGKLTYSSQHVSAVETCRKPPTLRFSRELDQAIGTAGTPESFEREWREMRHGVLLEGFPEYVGHESRAVEIRLYEVGVIPGLLQTPDYAATLEADAVRREAITQEQADERVELVAKRQAALLKSPSPLIIAVLDESCVRRPMGSPAVMDEQFARLIEFAERPHTVLQIAPFSMGERRPFSLPVTILTLSDRSLMSYAESSQQGHLERESAFVVPILAAYHQLQAESLSQAASVAMVQELRKGNS
ncbi:XRE family transcriptional regulator [Streptomyces nitrosporeus]|uniref:XRE family transcriptional regulator n=1 Tax=Streptomyces nitrosporeus TaxID=28894 RepID=A0A5J6FEB1_9ACTN|nr:helix-turn-helix transcriptional regulator [Streptomyces nitrosporeus]QEU73230.1 XRE family transcriptional regulator [Streptomyces nitrosporeus]GGZ09564.1 transcriptional regulator [Streptomyces nitrosporeus]